MLWPAAPRARWRLREAVVGLRGGRLAGVSTAGGRGWPIRPTVTVPVRAGCGYGRAGAGVVVPWLLQLGGLPWRT